MTLNDVTVNEGVGTATISASADHAPEGSNLVLTLSNGATITDPRCARPPDARRRSRCRATIPNVDHESYSVSVTGATAAITRRWNTTDTATVTVNDTITTNCA